MSYSIVVKPSFLTDVAMVPKRVVKAMRRSIGSVLAESPGVTSEAVKKLNGYRHLWRYRVSDSYRLIYAIDERRKSVCLLALGNRKDIYDGRFPLPESEAFDRVIALKPDILDPKPTLEQIGQVLLRREEEGQHNLLPVLLTDAVCEELGIPADIREVLIAAQTEDALQRVLLSVSQELADRVLNHVFPQAPRAVEEVVDEPSYVADDLSKLLEGDNPPLSSLLLQLDEEQEKIVDRFRRKGPRGPWIVKGCAGSGKSTIALYCLREVLLREAGVDGKPIRVLFTTYTNALKNAAEELLSGMHGENEVDFRTVDSLVRARADLIEAPAPERVQIELVREVIEEMNGGQASPLFHAGDARFVYEEIEWVIIGNAVESSGGYQSVDRRARSRELSKKEMEVVWRLYECFCSRLTERHLVTWGQLRRAAMEKVTREYDYVFIDEIQDLSAVALEFCERLAHDNRMIFKTGDLNQSIYGHGFVCSIVSAVFAIARRVGELVGTSRTLILKRNYRSTREIWEAILEIMSGETQRDAETLVNRAVHRGPVPRLMRYGGMGGGDSEVEEMSAFLKAACVERRVGPDCAAVLCRDWADANELAEKLPEWCNARPMQSKTFDVNHDGVKVATMHAVKGLEFPVVVVARVNKGVIPRVLDGTDEELGRERRLLFTACSRAMQHLAVMTEIGRESPLLATCTDDYWDD